MSIKPSDTDSDPANTNTIAISPLSGAEIPEDQLVVEYASNKRGYPKVGSIEHMGKSPPYLITCFDEFSRDLCTVRIGEMLPTTISAVNYSPADTADVKFIDMLNEPFQPFIDYSDNASGRRSVDFQSPDPSRILQHYHPGYSSWNATFRSSPVDSKKVLVERPLADSNILVKVVGCVIKNPFEPLFGSITLCLHRKDELIRISETFHFDVTSDAIKLQYPFVFLAEPVSVGDEPVVVPVSLKVCLMRIPEDLQGDPDLYFVIQINKVLTGDPEKALAPYLPRGAVPQIPKHEEQCSRLAAFRQSVGLGILKVYDAAGNVGIEGKPTLAFKLYTVKGLISEAQLVAVSLLTHRVYRSFHGSLRSTVVAHS